MLSALLPLADPQATFGIVSFGPKADMERSITGGAPLASNTNGAARRAVKVGREVAVLRAFFSNHGTAPPDNSPNNRKFRYHSLTKSGVPFRGCAMDATWLLISFLGAAYLFIAYYCRPPTGDGCP